MDCLSVIVAPWKFLWKRALIRLFVRLESWPLIFPVNVEVEVLKPASSSKCCGHGSCSLTSSIAKSCPKHACMPHKDKLCVIKAKQGVHGMDGTGVLHECVHPQYMLSVNGRTNVASLFTRQGLKRINQDAMIVWENFACQQNTIFCGVFDGHGPDGHLVARNVRDMLPQTLASGWQYLKQAAEESTSSSDDSETDCLLQTQSDSLGVATAWREAIVQAYKVMDRDLLNDEQVDCVSSGTTAVTLVKHGKDLIVGNVGDSRAVLGTRADDGTLLALQLTVDLKPNLQREADRIRRRKGRVFALPNEPAVHRVWLPHQNAPGLAMARALGDYCLKSYGVISEPEVMYRRLTKKDKFVVLATDGVWDVLSNEQVVKIVASTAVKSYAARAVVESAVRAWRSKHSLARMDDCAVVCLFLDD